MAFALGMDAFSVGLGMGMIRLKLGQIFKIGILIGLFHVWMPMLGMLAGRFLSEQFGQYAAYAGGLLMLILGVQMIWSSLKSDESRMITPVGFGLIVFALSVSLDSFSVGLTLGIYKAKTIAVLICFGLAATILTWAWAFSRSQSPRLARNLQRSAGRKYSSRIWLKAALADLVWKKNRKVQKP